MIKEPIRLTHPNDRLEALVQEHRRKADGNRSAAAEAERRGTDLFQKAARLRLRAMENDQVADRIASLLPPAAGKFSPITGEPLTASVAQGGTASYTRA